VEHRAAPPAELETEPAVAASLFGDRIDTARSFTNELAARGEELGLIGPLELPRLWTRHILNCVVAAPLFSGRVADIGSGAGLPGLVLAIARPDVRFTLVEPMERRVAWLDAEVARLELDNVEVLRARAEEVPVEPAFDQVTARAVSALAKLVPITAPLVRPGGELVFLKGERVGAEIEAAQKAFRRWKVADPEVIVLGEGVIPDITRVFRATVA
jgi:16S rRNA (guanine527-N7)-methyltransferase